jgi:hypothetical protein
MQDYTIADREIMEDAQQSHNFSQQIEMVLRREALLASGRKDAIQFAWDCKGDLPTLNAEVQETEELISDRCY